MTCLKTVWGPRLASLNFSNLIEASGADETEYEDRGEGEGQNEGSGLLVRSIILFISDDILDSLASETVDRSADSLSGVTGVLCHGGGAVGANC